MKNSISQVFEYLPIENMIWENQSEYYKAIQKSTDSNDSGLFVEFMLSIILKVTSTTFKKMSR